MNSACCSSTRNTTHKGRSSAVLLTVLLICGIVLSACSNAALSGPTISTSSIASAAKRSGSAHVSITVGSGISPSFKKVSIIGRASGNYSLSRNSGQVTFTGLGLPTGKKSEMVFTQNAVYMHAPQGLLVGQSSGNPWIRLLYNEAITVGTTQAGFLVTAEMLDPGFLLSELTSGTRTLHRSNTSGALTSYNGTLDLKPFAEKNGCGAGASSAPSISILPGLSNGYATPSGCVQSTLAYLEAGYSGSWLVPVTVWVNGNHVSKITAALDPIATWGEGGGSGRMPEGTTVTMVFSNFGAKVNTSLPPPGNTMDISSAFENTPLGIQPMTLDP